MNAGPQGDISGISFLAAKAERDAPAIIDIPELVINPGRITALSGPSGSGKSTLLYLLAGLLVPTTGAVSWGDQRLSTFKEAERDRWRRRNAGFVFQSFHLIEELSPLDNVLAASWFGGERRMDAAATARGLLERFGVPLGRRRAALLSNGEKQRVAIARALLFDPGIIFADEPTASLDTASGAIVIEALDDLARNRGKTIIAATHDPALLARADGVVRLEHGRIVSPARAEALDRLPL